MLALSRLFGASSAGPATASLGWSARKKLYEQLASQLENGRPLTEAMLDFRDRLERRGRKSLARQIGLANDQLRNGKTFVEALGPNMSSMERSALASGERAGQLPQSMRLILDVRERITRIQRKLMSYFTAPLVYLVTLIASLYVIGNSVVPPLAQVVPAEKWEGWARGMYFMGLLATGWGMFITVGVIVAVSVAVAVSLPRWCGGLRAWFDTYVFPYNVYRDVVGFTWLLSFTALLRSGVSDTAALQDQLRNGSPWLASRLQPLLDGLRDGLSLPDSMRRAGQGFPSMDLIDEIAAYVRFPDFSEKIDKVARDYSEQLERRMMLIGGAIGGVFSFAMFGAFGVITMGANNISDMITRSIGQ